MEGKVWTMIQGDQGLFRLLQMGLISLILSKINKLKARSRRRGRSFRRIKNLLSVTTLLPMPMPIMMVSLRYRPR